MGMYPGWDERTDEPKRRGISMMSEELLRTREHAKWFLGHWNTAVEGTGIPKVRVGETNIRNMAEVFREYDDEEFWSSVLDVVKDPRMAWLRDPLDGRRWFDIHWLMDARNRGKLERFASGAYLRAADGYRSADTAERGRMAERDKLMTEVL